MTSDEGKAVGTSWPAAQALDLDDLLEELRARAQTARHSQQRLGDLLDAVVAVGTNLDLAVVLSRIVQSASSLVNARYGALGVLSSNGEHLVEFITRGLTDEQREQIGEPPKGHGVLGLLIRDPHPRRMRDIQTHPESFGFPPNHPPMHSFLGAPIRIRDEVFGNLYMSEKIGASEFTSEDEDVLVALAAAASVAIDNARLYDAATRQRRWSESVSDVTQVLLEREDEAAALSLIVSHTQTLSRGSCAFVALYDESDDLTVRAVSSGEDGASGQHELGTALVGGHWADVREARQPVLLTVPDAPQREGGLPADVRRVTGLASVGPMALVPLPPGHGGLGVLVVTWDAEAEALPTETLPALTDYAQQVGLALLAGRAQRDRAVLALSDDRDRIARDMHDHVIQRLFATGLSLQSATRVAVHPQVQGRLNEAVDEIDAAIKEIRHAIFELHQPIGQLRPAEELQWLVASFKEGLGFAVDLVVSGRLDEVDPALWSDVVAVVREGLSNVVRHARASRAECRIAIDGLRVTVEIVDDGVGTDQTRPRSGLINLAERAAATEGDFDISRARPTGTRLRWSVPLGR